MNINNVDWEAIAARLPQVEDTRVHTAKLADMDFWILKAAAAVKKRGVAADSASLLSASIRRLTPEWCELIAFQAAQEGVSFEEMFVRLATGE
ncbi:hypothetical protein COO91_03401 [Nostoc flagelliforme CCNUN1]|uniref:Uncharacterized protein n=1 Tax=Nostoc flagelliforme CCNUN1 TaxID=2038116 RepID=A0A2K8SPR2_9NOSO|nr:hypothetical protein [Nostoc flagelliforme]AUB37456.1 hypothetical protein COO91_03401 [Nostoc flagelliforme CCNUN1]